MKHKRALFTVLLVALLAVLVYLQVRTWRKFDWSTFRQETEGVDLLLIGAGVALIYLDYFLRALRWKILLRPVCKTTTLRLLAPNIVGFTGLALFGRAGDLIRPYVVARKEGLTMSSQVAVLAVERVFDMGAFGLIMALNILYIWLSPAGLRDFPGFQQNPRAFTVFSISGAGLLVLTVIMAGLLFAMRRNPQKASAAARRLFGAISRKFGDGLARRVHSFGEGLNTVQDLKAFLQLSAISLLLWISIGVTYVCVTHAYPDPRLSRMTLSSVLLLTGGSVAGGILQLPVVGGGSQLATIGILRGVFYLSPELATSCGIMLWLVTFMSIVPTGLALAHREHVSLLRLEKESEQQTENALRQG